METPMLAMVNTVLRRLRQQFFRTSGRYRTYFRIAARRRKKLSEPGPLEAEKKNKIERPINADQRR
jgi:hypothetical protein